MYFFWENYAAATNLQIVFNNPKIPTYSIHPRKYSPNFPTEKNSRIENFKCKKNDLRYNDIPDITMSS